MQKLLLTTALLLCTVVISFAQNFAGKRIVSGNVTLSLSSNSFESKVGSYPNSLYNISYLNTNFLTGKIRANNTYVAYGFNASIGNTKRDGASNNSYTLGPTIQFGKFIKVFDQFYFSPNTKFSADVIWGNSNDALIGNTSTKKGFSAEAIISPINFLYQLNEKLLFNISFGSFSLNYQNITNSNDSGTSTNSSFNLGGSISNSVGIGAFYLF